MGAFAKPWMLAALAVAVGAGFAMKRRAALPWMLAALAVAVGAGVAMKRRAALPSTGACALLEQLVMTQRSVDAHIQMPKDFAYVPFEMVEACGSASFRMPYPYKIRLPSHSPLDQLYADFKALDKATVLTREIGEGPDDSDDYLRNSKFTKHSGSQEEPLVEGVESLSNGTKALFFDNSWTYDHFRPMLNEPERFDKIFENCLFGNMFTTNLTEQRFTAKAHSAPWYGSVAVQLAGVKRWKFWDPATFGAHGVPSDESSFENMAVSRILPSRGMTKLMKTIDHYDVVSSAGDLVYFPAFWTHIVYTDPGFNLMINLRARHHPSMALGWLRNALQIHSLIGMLKMAAIFTLVSVLPEEVVLAKLGKAHDAVASETEKTQTWLDEVEHSMNADSKFVQLHDNVGAIPSSKMF